MKNTKKKRLNPYKKKIHLPSGTWTYRVGDSVVLIRNSELSKTFKVSFSDITGMDHYQIEKGLHKRWFHVLPSHVRDYINNTILAKD